MMHLVESHLGGYYITDRKIEDIIKPCDECGDSDWIIVSFEEDNKLEILKEYFASKYERKEDIICDLEYMDVNECIDSFIFDYDCDRYMVTDLFESNFISKDEKRELKKVISKTKKKQFSILKEVVGNIDKNTNKELCKINNNI